MAVWNGEAMLAQHRCGERVWCESRRVGDGYVFTFYAFAIIGTVWWKGDVLTVCPRCGADYHPFMSREWQEA